MLMMVLFKIILYEGYKNVYETAVVGIGIPSQEWYYAQGHQGTVLLFYKVDYIQKIPLLKSDIEHASFQGANILVDNKGCIKLADFGASKKVVELV